MQLALRLQLVAPHHKIIVGGDDGGCLTVVLANLVFLGIVAIVAEIHTLDIDRCIGGVIQLHPVVALEVFVDVDAVGGSYLVDADGRDALCLVLVVAEAREGGGQFDGGVTGQVDGLGIRVIGRAFLPSGEAIAGRGLGRQFHGSEEVTVKQ